MPNYVTPDDMRSLYDEDILIQITNYSDRLSQEINDEILQAACDKAGQIVDGYLIGIAIKPENFSVAFKNVLRFHSARLAMDVLASADPQIREHAKETIAWLNSLLKLSARALQNLVEGGSEEPNVANVPIIEFGENDCAWEVTF